MKAKKSLGQHFLTSQKALSQIRDSADITGNDLILEIGPGRGILTEILLFFSAKVIAIEKDRDLIPILEEKFKKEIEDKKLEILEEDVLNFDPNILSFYKNHPFKLVANIPYYITGAILEKFLTANYQPEKMVLLIQKEVAERIIARDKKESILSLSVKAYGKPKIIARVPAGAFSPAPRVDSAILSIENISKDFFKNCNERIFFEIIKKTFNGKRKQIQKTFGEYLKSSIKAKEILEKNNIALTTRPEDLSLQDWKRLAISVDSFNSL